MALTFRLGIDDTSPTIVYSPSLENETNPSPLDGWVPFYSISGPASTLGQLGNGTSLHETALDGASLSITWSGIGIELYGYASQAVYEFTLDTTTLNYTKNLSAVDTLLLFSVNDLPNAQHTITMVVHTQSITSSFIAFDRAILIGSVDVINASLSSQVFSGSVMSYQGQWTFQNSLFQNLSYHVSTTTGDKALMNFIGTAITVSGLRNSTSGRYNVTLDGETSEFDAQSSWKEDAILYFKMGLDPRIPHSLEITNADQQSLAIGTINITSVSTSASSSNSFSAGSIAAIVLGIVLGLFIIGTLLLFFRRKRKRVTFIEPSIHKNQHTTRILDIGHDEGEDDKLTSPSSPSNHYTLTFAPNPLLTLTMQPKPTPQNLPRSPTVSSPSLSNNHRLRDSSRGSNLHHVESTDPTSYLSVNIKGPLQVEFENVTRTERRTSSSVKPHGPRDRKSTGTVTRGSLPGIEITSSPEPEEANHNTGISFFDFNSSQSSSVRQISSGSQPRSPSRSQLRLSDSSASLSRQQKRISEQSRSTGGTLSLSAALQSRSGGSIGQAVTHPYSSPVPPDPEAPLYSVAQASPTDSMPLTVSEVNFREMDGSDPPTSRRASYSYPGWYSSGLRTSLPHPSPTGHTFSPTIVQKLFGSRPTQPGERRNSNRRSFLASVPLSKTSHNR